MRRYFIYTYLLLIRYQFYSHFLNLILIKIKNIFTFYKIKEIEKIEKIKSEQLCNKKYINNQDFFNSYKYNNISFQLINKNLDFYKKKFYHSYEKKGPANLELLYFCSKLISANKILETGVADGWSSLIFLLHLSEQKKGNLTSIDLPYLNTLQKYQCGKVIDKNLKSFWNLIVKPDEQGINMLIKSSSEFDLIHYDSDKSIQGREKNYPKLWDMLNNGGIFISDDINDNMSFFKFCDVINKKPLVIKYKKKFQGIILK